LYFGDYLKAGSGRIADHPFSSFFQLAYWRSGRNVAALLLITRRGWTSSARRANWRPAGL